MKPNPKVTRSDQTRAGSGLDNLEMLMHNPTESPSLVKSVRDKEPTKKSAESRGAGVSLSEKAYLQRDASSQLSDQLKLQEIEQTKLSLLMLQKYVIVTPKYKRKRTELEQLRTLLAVALERYFLYVHQDSGDTEALYQLGEMINCVETPQMSPQDTTPPPEMQSAMADILDNLAQAADPRQGALEAMLQRQAAKKEQLLNLQDEQSNLHKSAETQYDALLQKRTEMEALQSKLQDLSGFRFSDTLEDEETEDTIIPATVAAASNAFEKHVSESTLVPEEDLNEEEDDEDLDEDDMTQEDEREIQELQANLARLRDQEDELRYLRQHLDSLRTMKTQMEDKAGELVAQTLEQEEDVGDASEPLDAIPEELTLQNLLERLAAVSVPFKESAATDAQTDVPKIIEIVEETPEQEVVDVSEGRIKESISQAMEHIKDLEMALTMAENPEEKKVYADLLLKLTSQMDELKAVDEKLSYFKTLVQKSAQESVALPVVPEETWVETQTPELVTESGSKAPPVRAAWVQRRPMSAMNADRLVRKVSTDSWTAKRPASVMVAPTETMRGAWVKGRPSSSMMAETSSVSESIAPQTKRLFESCKDDIYRGAASLMSAFESEPYFLLTVLKKLPKLNSSYLRQKLLMTLDELLEEKENLEAQESLEKDSASESSRPKQEPAAGPFSRLEDSGVTRYDVEELIKERVADYLIYRAHDPSNPTLTAHQLSQMSAFILSLIHGSLYTMIDMTEQESAESQEDLLTLLIDSTKNNLESSLHSFLGTRLNLVQGDILQQVLDIVQVIFDRWEEGEESPEDRCSRWERFPAKMPESAFEDLLPGTSL